jgi:hypothetical protein
MQLPDVPCPLIGQQPTVGLVIDEMFRYEIAHWAKILSTLTMNTLAVLAAVRASALLAVSYRSRPIGPEAKIDPRPNMAIAYVQVSRLNR